MTCLYFDIHVSLIRVCFVVEKISTPWERMLKNVAAKAKIAQKRIVKSILGADGSGAPPTGSGTCSSGLAVG